MGQNQNEKFYHCKTCESDYCIEDWDKSKWKTVKTDNLPENELYGHQFFTDGWRAYIVGGTRKDNIYSNFVFVIYL